MTLSFSSFKIPILPGTGQTKDRSSPSLPAGLFGHATKVVVWSVNNNNAERLRLGEFRAARCCAGILTPAILIAG